MQNMYILVGQGWQTHGLHALCGPRAIILWLADHH